MELPSGLATAPSEASHRQMRPASGGPNPHRVGGPDGTLTSLARGQVFALVSVGVAWACTTVTAVTFGMAAMSPGNRVTVAVNDYGEMPVETIVLGAAWVIVTLNFSVLWWKLWNRPATYASLSTGRDTDISSSLPAPPAGASGLAHEVKSA